MEYLIRFAQAHETFRRPEINALASLAGIDLEIVSYDQFVGIYFYMNPFLFSLRCIPLSTEL